MKKKETTTMSDFYVCHSSHVSWRSVADHVLIVDHKKRQLLTLNDVAGTIWQLSDTWVHIDQIVDSIRSTYSIDRDTAKSDVKAFVLSLLSEGLLITDRNDVMPIFEKNDSIPGCFNENAPADLKSFCQKNSIPLVACLEITERCNLRCRHCYNSPKRKEHELSFSEITSTLDEMASLGSLDLILTGGEPMVRDDFSEILWYARKKKFAITLKTNATKINKNTAQLLKKAFVIEVDVSLYSLLPHEHDSITGIPGSLAKTLRGIECLAEAGLKIHIACPLTTINYKAVTRIKQFALEIGATCGFDPVITAKVDGNKSPLSIRIGRVELEELCKDGTYSGIIFPHLSNTSDRSATMITIPSEKEIDLPICGAGSSMVFVSAYGDVFPCVALPINAGNIRSDSLTNIWKTSPVMREVRSLTPDKFIACQHCDKIGVCLRCPGIFFTDTGSAVVPSQAICLIANYSQQVMKGGEFHA